MSSLNSETSKSDFLNTKFSLSSKEKRELKENKHKKQDHEGQKEKHCYKVHYCRNLDQFMLTLSCINKKERQ